MGIEKLPRVNEDDAEEIRSFISNYIANSGLDGVVVGLSGGIDSAVVTKLAVDALGPEKVHCIFLPTGTTPKEDYECTEKLAKKWNVGYESINIQNAVDEMRKIINQDLDPLDLGNISARCRMIILYSRAKTMNRLVLGTSNQSELMMGYFTKYGDGACDLLPLINMYKTNVFQLARMLSIPEEIINKPPSAGFWEGQTDEEDFGVSYSVLDSILYSLEQEKNERDISTSFDVPIETVQYIKNRVKTMEHKRLSAARPGNSL